MRRQQRAERGLGKPETFDFLGFTYICGKSKQGKFLLCRKSRRDRMRAKLKDIRRRVAAADASADPGTREVVAASRCAGSLRTTLCRRTAMHWPRFDIM